MMAVPDMRMLILLAKDTLRCGYVGYWQSRAYGH